MNEPQTHPLKWPPSIDAVWLAMPFFVVTVRTLLQPIPPQDYWWHLAMGRYIAQTGEIPATNMYLYTMPADAPFFDQPWLAQWVMYSVVHSFGHVATVALHLLLILAAWGALVLVASRRGATPIVVGIAASMAHYMSATTLTPRTQMFAYPLIVVFLAALLFAAEAAPRRRALFWGILGVITAFWANVHGSFILAPVLTLAVLAGVVLEHTRRRVALDRSELVTWIGATAVTLLGVCVSPHGLENLIYPFSILGATKGEGPAVVEWLPPGLHLQGLVFYGAMIGSAAIFWLRRREVRLWELAPFALTGLIALTSSRGVLWWALCAVLVVAPHAAALARAPSRESTTNAQGFLNVGFLAAFLAVSALCWPGAPLFRAVEPEALFGEGRLADSGQAAVLSATNPAGLGEALRAYNGRIFAEQSAAGYIEFAIVGPTPRPIVFVDQRLELIDVAIWDDYFHVTRVRDGWREVLERYDISAVLVHEHEQPRLLDALRAAPGWELRGNDRMWWFFVQN